MSHFKQAREALIMADQQRTQTQLSRDEAIRLDYQRALILAVLALADEVSAISGQCADGLFIRK